MQQNDDGFYSPIINNKICTGCGLCLQSCPVFSYETNQNKRNNIKTNVFAAINKDEQTRLKSSSGGIFTLLSNYVLSKSGIIFGAEFDESFQVIHSACSEKTELNRFFSSKYSQSDIGESFRLCKEYLEEDKNVLFSGSPCQIQGLKSFLGKNYENLITVDFVCHGIPSPALWQKYLQFRKSQFLNSEIETVNFREKSTGWENYCVNINFKNGSTYKADNGIDCFMNVFINDECLNESCYNCRFKGIERNCDFTLADFWGIESILPDFYDNKGTSLLFVHTEKAKKILENIKGNLTLKELTDEEIKKAVNVNSSAVSSSLRPDNRDLLKNRLQDKNFFSNYMNKPELTVGILNHVFSSNNYGALLVAYAMETLVREYGFNPVTIYLDLDGNKSEVFSDFRTKYLNITKPLSRDKLPELNKYMNTFCTGSDQVWRNWWRNEEDFFSFFASFADYRKNIFSYAASFGIKKFPESNRIKAKVKNLLSSFSSISVREESGLEILKDEFNLTGHYVLDPTLLPNRIYYEKIIQNEMSQIEEKSHFITSMIFTGESSDTEICHNAIRELAEERKLEIVKIFGNGYQVSVPQWLYYISHSDFNIVDSYHALLFSLIFNKNFVCLTNAEGGNERFYSILKTCGIENKLLPCNEISKEKLDEKLNIGIKWSDVEKRLSKARDYSRKYFYKALNSKVEYNSKLFYQEPEQKKSIKTLIKIFLKKCLSILK